MPTETFTAGDDFVVPNGVFELTVELEGEAGRELSNSQFDTYGDSGDGGRVAGVLPVSPGETLYIRSSPGGDSPQGQDGGDSVDIRRGGTALSDRVVVAAGGGGGGNLTDFFEFFSAPGGDGGADTGEDGGGQGGTQTAGGAGDTDDVNGDDGEFGPGGDGGSDPNGARSGGGGAGWYGGGGGATQVSTQGNPDSTGGGGGSNYDDGLDTATANERGTSTRAFGNGQVTITYDQQAGAENVEITDTTATSNTLDWDAPPLTPDVDSIEQYRVYRATDAGTVRADYTEVATVPAGTTTYDDTGLDNGITYHYRIGADLDVNGTTYDSALSAEVQATTALPGPLDLSISAVGATDATYTWTARHTNGETRVEYQEDQGDSWTTATTVAFNTEQAIVSTLLNGELYAARVVAETADAETVDIDTADGETTTVAE